MSSEWISHAGEHLAEWRSPEHSIRIRVTCWREVAPVADQFIVRPRSLRLVWEYLRHLGPVAVVRKVLSRMAETGRNRKAAGIGIGVVCGAPQDSGFEAGDWVVYFASNHRPKPDCLVLDRRFVMRVGALPLSSEHGEGTPTAEALFPYVGWSAFSGIPVDQESVKKALQGALYNVFTPSEVATLDTADQTLGCSCTERIERPSEPKIGPKAVLFGLGNYAKTQIVPYINGPLDLNCIHEIDLEQISTARRWDVTLDTSPWPRGEEAYDVWFVAGFHHTHAPIAVEALQQGAYAVVEKPLATTWYQLRTLENSMTESGQSRLLGCFQRRYTPMNVWAQQDLGVSQGDPINYHCIVYEIPLPKRHWYNWPNSRSRITSNGCHWIDHFLFLNGYSQLTKYQISEAGNQDLFVLLETENGACFSMVLTEHGSERLGVRDYVELRAGAVTVRIIDQSYYESENSQKVIRRTRINPSRVYAGMYSAAVKMVLNNEEGDHVQTLKSTWATLLLEDQLMNEQPRTAGPFVDMGSEAFSNPSGRYSSK